MTQTQRTVTVETMAAGVNFAVIGVIRDSKTGRKLATTNLRPNGCERTALYDGYDMAASKGWRVVARDDE